MLLAFIAVVVGLVLLIWSAEKFIDGAVKTGCGLLPPVIVTATDGALNALSFILLNWKKHQLLTTGGLVRGVVIAFDHFVINGVINSLT